MDAVIANQLHQAPRADLTVQQAVGGIVSRVKSRPSNQPSEEVDVPGSSSDAGTSSGRRTAPVGTEASDGPDAPGPAIAPGSLGVIVVAVDSPGWFPAAHGFADAAEVGPAALRSVRTAMKGRAVVEPGPVDHTLVVQFDTDAHGVEDVAGELVDHLTHPLRIAGQEHFIQSRLGSATTATVGSPDPELLLRAAFAAAHVATVTGEHRHAATPSLLADLREASELRTAMAQAATSQFELHYQPIVDLATSRVLGYESLMRWRRGGELLTPAAFLPAAEETALILPIGRAGTRAALEQLAEWRRRRPGEPLFVSVNFSARQLSDPRLLDHVRDTLGESELDPSLLWVEITECALIDVDSPAVHAIESLAEMGCVICVDDLGTGFAALRYLADLPVSVVKIDRTLVGSVADPAIRKIIGAISDICHSLEIATVAEGVEHLNQVPLLRELGFSHAQGFFYGRPTAAPTPRLN